jgi:rhodanese-related sulfurtransferase
MRWKQLFTPVQSMDAPEAKTFMEQRDVEEYNLIDVRQPGEYEGGHIPGSKLIPLPDLNDRLSEIDPAKPTLVY